MLCVVRLSEECFTHNKPRASAQLVGFSTNLTTICWFSTDAQTKSNPRAPSDAPHLPDLWASPCLALVTLIAVIQSNNIQYIVTSLD